MTQHRATRIVRLGLVALVIFLGSVPRPLAAQDAGARPRGLLRTPMTFRWGPQSPDLVRYNRVEGASLGVRWQMRPRSPWGALTVGAEARLGTADLAPNTGLSVARETLHSRFTLRAFHELAAVDERAKHLGVGNSLMALMFGRDDGEYFRRSGFEFEWRPPSSRRATFRATGFAERHSAVETSTDVDLWHLRDSRWRSRQNLVADEGWELGGQLALSPEWGTDRRAVQGGVDARLRAAVGDFEYARLSLSGRVGIPLQRDLRLDLEAGGGTSAGQVPAQRLWLLGGAGSIRGYAPRVLEGSSYLRGGAALARRFAFGAVSLFIDAGWAGERDAFDAERALLATGLGLTLADGLIHFDVGHGLRAPRSLRLDLYLDAIL